MVAHALRQFGHERMTLLGGAALFVVIVASDAISLLLAQHAGSMLSLWSTNGIAVGVLLSVQRRYWTTLIATIVAALLAGQYVAFGTLQNSHLLLVPVHLVEILIVTCIIHQHLSTVTGQASGYLRFGRVAIGAALVGCLISTLLASVVQKLKVGS